MNKCYTKINSTGDLRRKERANALSQLLNTPFEHLTIWLYFQSGSSLPPIGERTYTIDRSLSRLEKYAHFRSKAFHPSKQRSLQFDREMLIMLKRNQPHSLLSCLHIGLHALGKPVSKAKLAQGELPKT